MSHQGYHPNHPNSSYSFIQPNVDFSTKNLYNLVDMYFDQPIMEKMKNEKGMSIYICKLATLLASVEQRYLIAICHEDLIPVGSRLPLKNIEWKNFQSRTLPEKDYIVKTKHSYLSKNGIEYQVPVYLKQRYEDHTDYMVDDKEVNIKCTITLLHKKKNLYTFPDSGTIGACLETFQTVIMI